MKTATKIQSFDDVLDLTNTDKGQFATAITNLPKHVAAHWKAALIAEAFNAGWQPDWNNDDQNKYQPWFRMYDNEGAEPGSGFSLNFVSYDFAGSCVPSRLCFESRAKAEAAVKQFPEVYKDLFLF